MAHMIKKKKKMQRHRALIRKANSTILDPSRHFQHFLQTHFLSAWSAEAGDNIRYHAALISEWLCMGNKQKDNGMHKPPLDVQASQRGWQRWSYSQHKFSIFQTQN